MNILILGLILFLGTHLIPSVVPLRTALKTKLGEKPYMAVYALLSLTGLILIITGMARAEFIAVYQPVAWGKHLVMLAMLISMYLFAAADMKSNLKRFIRHPMLSGTLIWSCAHLLANGDQKSILLFGSFAVYSVIAMISANLRGATRQTTRYPLKKDLIAVAAGVVAYLVFVLVIHPYLFRIPLF